MTPPPPTTEVRIPLRLLPTAGTNMQFSDYLMRMFLAAGAPVVESDLGIVVYEAGWERTSFVDELTFEVVFQWRAVEGPSRATPHEDTQHT